jgi:anti-sigma factor RsiW
MNRPLPHSEIQELLGAFALDAVDADEAATIEAHLATCPRCRDEVRDHREVASLLAYAGTRAPAGLWERLAASLDEAPPAAEAPELGSVRQISQPVAARTSGAARSSRRRRPAARVAAAVVAATMLAGLGAVGGAQMQAALNTDDPASPVVGSRERILEEALAAAREQGSRTVHLLTPQNAPIADAVVTAGGTGYLIGKGAPALPDGRTYQLWAVANGEKLSVGVLGGEVDVLTFQAPKALDALALTVERSPGVVASQNQAVGYGLVRG